MQLVFVSPFSVSVLESTRNKHVCCLVVGSSQYMTYSTMEIVNETESINLSDIYMAATLSSETNYASSVLTSENSASISSTPPIPSNCYRVCVCNHMNPTPSSVNMSYTASVNSSTANYSSSVWPTPSSSVSEPFVCSNQSCWWEVECRTCKYAPSLQKPPSVLAAR